MRRFRRLPSNTIAMEGKSMHEYTGGISDELIAAFLDGNINGEEMEAVAEALADDKVLAEMMSLSPVIDNEVSHEQMRVLPINALAAANPDNLCSFRCEMFVLGCLGIDTDHWSLLETAKANNWLREQGTPLHHVGRLLEMKGLHVERRYDAKADDIQKALRENKHVIAIIDKNELSSMPTSNANPTYHAVYVDAIDASPANGKVFCIKPFDGDLYSIDLNVFLQAWRKSGCYMVAVSDSSGVYDPQPIDVADIDLEADLEDLTEAIAENAHDIWARARMDEGWTYGPVRNDELKQHPDLVSYSQLPDSEKEYDRLMAMNTLRLVRRLGFDITKK